MSEQIKLGLNIALAVFILFGIIFGLIRGLRKTASRGIFLIITSIILLFVTIPITNLLLKIQINTSITINENTLTGMNSLETIISFVVQSYLGETSTSLNSEFVEVITAIPLVFVNTFVYVILFWLLKYLLIPINSLFYKITFAPKKPKENLNFNAFGDDDNDLQSTNNYIENEEENKHNYQIDLFKDFTVNNSTSNNEASNINNQTNTVFNGKMDIFNKKNNIRDDYQEKLEMAKSEDYENIQTSQTNSNLETTNLSNDDGVFIKPDHEYSQSTNLEQFNTSNIIEDKKGKKLKKEKKKKEKIKYKKHRLLGGLVGAGVGLFVMLNTLIPVYGFIDILEQANTITVQNISDEDLNLSNQTNGTTDEIIEAYNNSILKYVSKYSGIEGLGLAEFNLLTTQTINGKKIILRDDINNLILTLKKTDEFFGTYKSFLPSNDYSAVTQEQLTILISQAKDVLNTAKKVNIVDCVSNYLIPVASAIILESNTNFTQNVEINSLIKDALTTLNSSKNINAFEETTKLLDLIEYINNQGLLIKIIRNDFAQPINIIQNLSEDFSVQFTNKLFALKTVNLTIPYIVNIGINFLGESLKIEIENSTSNAETIKTSITKFIDQIFQFSKTIDTESDIYITNKSLIPLGKVLENAKTSGLLHKDTYTNLINYATHRLKDLLAGLLPSDFENYVKNELLENIIKVDNWEIEMSRINNAILKLRDVDNGILGEVVEGENLRQGTSINITVKQSVLENIGTSLDVLESTCLFGAVSYKTSDNNNYKVSGTVSMFLSLLDFIETSILEDNSNSTMQKVSQIISELKSNLITSNHTYSSENPFWHNELKSIAPLFVDLYYMIENQKFDIEESLGKNLDTAKSSTILNSDSTLSLMRITLDIVKDEILEENYIYNDGSNSSTPQNLNDKIYELFESIKTNLQTVSIKEQARTNPKFWTEEIKYYIALSNIAQDATKLVDLSEISTLSENLDLVMNSITIPRSCISNVIAYSLKEIKFANLTSEDYVKLAINDTIDNIAFKLETETFFDDKDLNDFWSIEMNYLKSLSDIKFQDEEDYKVLDNLDKIGQTLDHITNGYITNDTDLNQQKEIRASYLILHNDIRNILSASISEISSTITSQFGTEPVTSDGTNIPSIISRALNSIKDNILDTTNIPNVSFEFELKKLQMLTKLEIDESMLNYPSGTESEIESQLNSNLQSLQTLGKQLDQIAFNYQKNLNNIYEYISEQNSKFITRQILSTLIKDIFNLGKQEVLSYDEPNTQTKKNAFNNLIENIQSNIEKISITDDKIISWSRELSYVNSLVMLNKDTTFTSENIASELGRNLDLIAFNQTSNLNVLIFDDIVYDEYGNCTYIPSFTLDTDLINSSSNATIVYNGNSLFITRDNIITTISEYLSTMKQVETTEDSDLEKEKKTIINQIIDNITNIASTNDELNNITETTNYSATYYKNMYSAFSDLYNIETEINNLTSNLKDIDIKTMTVDLAKDIDSLLNAFEYKPALQVVLTRKLALHMLKYIAIPLELQTTETGLYYNSLKTHYIDNSNNSQSENYLTDPINLELSNYTNPYQTLINSIPKQS